MTMDLINYHFKKRLQWHLRKISWAQSKNVWCQIFHTIPEKKYFIILLLFIEKKIALL